MYFRVGPLVSRKPLGKQVNSVRESRYLLTDFSCLREFSLIQEPIQCQDETHVYMTLEHVSWNMYSAFSSW